MWPFASRPEAPKKRDTSHLPKDPNAEILAEILASTPHPIEPGTRREPDWIDPDAPTSKKEEDRPYLRLGAGELERHAREEVLPEGEAGVTVPGPAQLFSLLTAPFQALPEGVRHVAGAIAIFGALGLGIQFVLKPVLVLCGALDP